jgi:FAD/FMN-containing dehydrogenase
MFGLGVDNVLEVEIVTADFKVLKLNSCTNEDLFWAVKGGGGGTWGVVTSLTYEAHDPPKEKTFIVTTVKAPGAACEFAGVDCATELVRALMDWISFINSEEQSGLWSSYPFWANAEHDTLFNDGSNYMVVIANFLGNTTDA